MQTHHTLTLFSFFLLFLSLSEARTLPPQDLLHSSCTHSRYPTLCLQTLSTFTGPTKTTLNLAQAAIQVSLTHARALSSYLNTLHPQPPSNKRNQVALSDCAKQISDSVDELSKTLNELQHLHMGTFQWQMSNAETWASTALTNGDICLNGFNDGGDRKMMVEVKRRVNDVAMLTSNALYFIDRVGQTRSGKPHVNP
ncbi:hypothetical protein TanjilG_29199 [Lupinus angustifolius]|uniref:Pectinesterase inhibitor domain-containing protein n=1 Tax=Lupinus angustifolius TaxID=3871 RepID=A0A1J7HCX9_LUPAN|nr:PREDICTED: 21 kDa protein-like [Lupinus angustifolius]OIW00209.1 hypothetical protein TanjilG_29199 [Lupinus angustifolius]